MLSIPLGYLPESNDWLILQNMDKFERRRQRLIELLDTECGGVSAVLARRIGKDPSYVTRMLYPEGKPGKKRIADDMMEEIETAFPLPRGWMDRLDASSQNISNVDPAPNRTKDVPVISWVTAGKWAEVIDIYSPGVADDWFPCVRKHGARTFALRVRGVSMQNPNGKHSYADGDIIFVDPDRQADNGARVVVRLDDNNEATFKQLVIEGEKKFLLALNPAWPEKIIEINGNATICGVVIGKWTDE